MALADQNVVMARSRTNSNIRDSIEDLPSSVPRSPQATNSPRRYNSELDTNQTQLSPSQQSSPLLPELDGLHVDIVKGPAASRSAKRDVNSSALSSAEYPALSLDSGSPRSRKMHFNVSHLELDVNDDSAIVSRQMPRPFSPFTPAGLLRRFTSNEATLRASSGPPPRARSAEPCVATRAVPEEHARAASGGAKEAQGPRPQESITRVQRSRHPFLGFHGWRLDRRSAT